MRKYAKYLLMLGMMGHGFVTFGQSAAPRKHTAEYLQGFQEACDMMGGFYFADEERCESGARATAEGWSKIHVFGGDPWHTEDGEHYKPILKSTEPSDVPAIAAWQTTQCPPCKQNEATACIAPCSKTAWTCADLTRILEHDEQTPPKYWCRKVQTGVASLPDTKEPK